MTFMADCGCTVDNKGYWVLSQTCIDKEHKDWEELLRNAAEEKK